MLNHKSHMDGLIIQSPKVIFDQTQYEIRVLGYRNVTFEPY
jgi:hypothetical protein